jgi:hypothetical protein
MDYGNLKVPENVTPEVQAILDSYEARNKEIENAHRKNTGRIWLGSALSGASAHPILNVPYVGTGLGGALYELGQGITEGDKLPELAKRTGTGFAIGETVGAIPYAGKYANKLSGGKIGNAFTAGVEKLASTPLGQKVAEIAPKVEDLLMTDIKAFNPNRQTVYHGSPYDFAKFSNEAIGTGEGAQAHGYGHYAAKNKDVAEGYRNRLGGGETILYNGKSPRYVEFKGGISNAQLLEAILYRGKNGVIKHLEKTRPFGQETDELINYVKSIDENALKKQTSGQLYKLSIPKDDVMLREDYSYNKQPQKVKKALDDILNKQLKEKNIKNLGIDTQTSPGTIERTLHTYKYYPGTDAGHIYDIINNNNNATEIFNNAGIKGISYNGGIDGEARVIFNPDDIEIVRKYYNQPSLGEMLLKKSPNAGATSNYLYDLMIRE